LFAYDEALLGSLCCLHSALSGICRQHAHGCTIRDKSDIRLQLAGRAFFDWAAAFDPNVVEGRFMVHVRHVEKPWIVIVEPDADAKLLGVVTVYEVSND
jgi:hypothetical protein